MAQSFEDLGDKHVVDQSIAEALAMGSIRIVGKNEAGDDMLQLTAKGTTRAAVMLLEALIVKADEERRDFSEAEKSEVLKQFWTVRESLLKR